MNDADLLRRAAARARELAVAATPGPWRDAEYPEPHIGEFGWYVAGCPAGETEDSPQGRADADHIAAWDPNVALVVADWLDVAAETPGFGAFANGRKSHVGKNIRAALDVARAFLREDGEPT